MSPRPSLDHGPLSLEWWGGCENGEGARKKRLVEMICLYGGVACRRDVFPTAKNSPHCCHPEPLSRVLGLRYGLGVVDSDGLTTKHE